MGRLILVAGPSGSGKSTSIRNLNATETFIIKPNSKPLPFLGGRKAYSKDAKNLLITKSMISLKSAIKNINEKAPHIKNIVIEDFFHFILAKTMNDINKTGFNKFKELANEVYMATSGLEHELRDDLNLIMLTHTEEVRDAAGNPVTKLKVTGKMIEDVVDLPSFFTYVFESKVIFTDGVSEYKFLSNKQSDADVAKTPFGMFDTLHVDNDLEAILTILDEKE